MKLENSECDCHAAQRGGLSSVPHKALHGADSCDMSDSLSNRSRLHIDPTHSRNNNSCNTSAKFSKSSNLHIDPTHSRNGNSCQTSGKSSKTLNTE